MSAIKRICFVLFVCGLCAPYALSQNEAEDQDATQRQRRAERRGGAEAQDAPQAYPSPSTGEIGQDSEIPTGGEEQSPGERYPPQDGADIPPVVPPGSPAEDIPPEGIGRGNGQSTPSSDDRLLTPEERKARAGKKKKTRPKDHSKYEKGGEHEKRRAGKGP